MKVMGINSTAVGVGSGAAAVKVASTSTGAGSVTVGEKVETTGVQAAMVRSNKTDKSTNLRINKPLLNNISFPDWLARLFWIKSKLAGLTWPEWYWCWWGCILGR